MSKKTAGIILIILIVVGSIFTFFSANLLFSDLANIFPGYKDNNFITSLPLCMTMNQFILAILYVARYIRRPQYVKSMTKKYLIIFMAFSLVGIITSIMSGVMIYHSFFKPYPIPAYCFTMILVNVILIAAAVYFYILTVNRMPDDAERRPFSVKHVFKTIGYSLGIFFVLERFGAALYFPFYIQWRTIYMSWPFFFTLLAPMSMCVQSFLYVIPKYKENVRAGLIFAIVNLAVAFAAHLAICITGYYNSKLLSAISPAMAIDRLDCSTKSLILVIVVTATIGVLGLVNAIIIRRKVKGMNTISDILDNIKAGKEPTGEEDDDPIEATK
ncbi:MAG: hypothetical protein K6E21_04620 [Bacilli bacterium]|nr:hypothetical protein [Bacilli bacterium]